MTRFLEISDKIVRVLSFLCLLVAGLTIVAMMVHICLDVLIRSTAATPLIGTLEIVSNYYMVAVCFLPLTTLVYRMDQPFVEVFTRKLSPLVIARLDGTANFLAFLTFISIALSSGFYAMEQTRKGEFLDLVYFDLPIWPTRWIAAVGFLAASVAAVHVLVASARTAMTPLPAQD